MKLLEEKLITKTLRGDEAGALDCYRLLLNRYRNCFSHICKLRSLKNYLICINCVLYNSCDPTMVCHKEILNKRNDFILKTDKESNIDRLLFLGQELIIFYVGINHNKCFYTQNPTINKALNYIHNNLSKDISLERVAKEVHISKSHLCNLFSQYLNCSFSAYINKAKVDYSKQLLSTSTMPLVDIAFKSVFNSQSYFCSTFKKIEGITPLQYKKSHIP